MKKSILSVISILLMCSMLFSVSTLCTAAQTKENKVNTIIDDTANHLLSLKPQPVSSVGGEWIVLGLSRAGKVNENYISEYYDNVKNYVYNISSDKLSTSKSTENSRVIIALTSIAKDVEYVGRYNLLQPLYDMSYITKQGINGAVFALMAFDTLDYEFSSNNSENSATREKLITYILNNQLANGGWALYGEKADADITAMVIQSVAKYYANNLLVKAAVDKALKVLSDMQTSTGGFASFGNENCETSAQVLTALTALKINPETDSRFIKNGNSVIDSLINFSVQDGFSHTLSGKYNQMTTEQAFYALVSYQRFVNSRNSLYDMSDIKDIFDNSEDINLDGNSNISDCTYIQKYLAKKVSFSRMQEYNSDFDNSGKVSIMDVTLIQKSFAKKSR